VDLIKVYEGKDACQQCLGWKRVDDGEQLSWKYWAELPAQSRIAIELGFIKPVKCPRCNGLGKEPKKE
jgi:DnaJ-class molecular chaperone